MPRPDPRTRRYPCAFCDLPDRWPDRCREAFGEAEDLACDIIVPGKCQEGDHRRCEAAACASAARWHDPVREAGIQAARSAGTVWAVVSTLEGEVTVVGTEDHLGRAKSILRTGHARRFGIKAGDPAAKGYVYVVRGSDGGFF